MQLPEPVQVFAARVLGWHRIVTARAVMTRFGAAGGGLLAGGLTYSALFALLPTLVLLTAVLGLIVDEPDRRRAVVDALSRAFPPLAEFLAASMDEVARGAPGLGLIGLVGLAWGASRFYGSLDDAFGRIFSGVPARGFVARTIRGVVSVGLILSAALLALTLTGLASFLTSEAAPRLGIPVDFWSFAAPLLAAVVLVAGTVIVYRIVPARRVPWRAALTPAVVVGVAIAVLTQAFSFIAPRLIGTAALFGTFVAVFAAMVWMSTTFQLLLIGAAWVRERIGEPPPPFLERG